MINSGYAFSAYRQLQYQTASNEEIVVLLFDGIVRFLHQARAAMEIHQLELQSDAINRAQRVLSELTSSLDEAFDPELVTSLRCCYSSMYNRLYDANINDDLQELDEVIAMAERFAQAWRVALGNLAVESATMAVAG